MKKSTTVTLPKLRLEGLGMNGETYLRRGDVVEYLFACAETAKKEGLPIEVEQFLNGIGKFIATSKLEK